MDKEFLHTLRKYANFTIKKGYGAINLCPECKNMTKEQYNVHYDKCVKQLESLSWNKVENPRMLKKNEYPSEDGDYITMLDCDEHSVYRNIFSDGHWLVYDRTHVKWWIKVK